MQKLDALWMKKWLVCLIDLSESLVCLSFCHPFFLGYAVHTNMWSERGSQSAKRSNITNGYKTVKKESLIFEVDF